MPELKVPETGDVVVRRALDKTASTVQCLERRARNLEGSQGKEQQHLIQNGQIGQR